MGDRRAPSLDRQTKQLFRVLQTRGPDLLRTFDSLNRELAPGQAELESQLYQQYEPQYFETGERLQDIATGNAIRRDRENIQGGGRQLAQEAIGLDQLANPEFYANRQLASRGFADLIGGQDPNKLTGGELANVERGVNRLNANSGVSNVGDATTTASNALLFDDRLQGKRNQFAQHLNLFPGIQQGSQSGVNAYQIAAGRGAAAGNVGLGQRVNPQQFDANAGFQGILGTGTQIQQGRETNLQSRRTGADFVNQALTATGSALGGAGGCCFIFLEAYNGQLPYHVRLCRDLHYEKHPSLAVGYKKMAKWLVPLMKKYRVMAAAVNHLMVKPISRYGEWLVGDSPSHNKIDKLIRKLWFYVWKHSV